MQEHWIRYTTDKIFEKMFYFDSLTYHDESLTITLYEPENRSQNVHVAFTDSVKGVRSTNESYAYLTLDTLIESYGKDFYTEHTFFRVFESDYLFSFENHQSLLHFAVFSVDWLIDVITTKEPIITLAERKEYS
ncbi:MAG: hypothetical protein M1300_02735 [Epsilonproteobacteria bacterium]|nr:hypothetical protein [Campylobacterota bacterium]